MRAVVAVRAGCTSMRHDTAAAYRKYGCRCEAARRDETARKARYDSNPARRSRVRPTQMWTPQGGCPPFHLDPRRGCADLANPDLMFPEGAKATDKALRICRYCPLKKECAEWAVQTKQTYGIWGETTPMERAKEIAHREGRTPA